MDGRVQTEAASLARAGDVNILDDGRLNDGRLDDGHLDDTVTAAPGFSARRTLHRRDTRGNAMPATSPVHSGHYDAAAGETYFAWQRTVGEFGGWANVGKFVSFLKPDDRVVDFGCGGGYLLAQLPQREKRGIEVSDSARATAHANGITALASAKDLPDGWADVVISNHALEHTLHPLAELKELRRVLRPGGRIVFVVPNEGVFRRWDPADVNHHLYTWAPLNLGHLFTEAGFVVDECRPYYHKWPPFHRAVARFGGRRLFDLLSKVWSQIDRRWFQVRIVAHRAITD